MDERERRSGVLRQSARTAPGIERLVEALSDPSWRVRAAAVDTLGAGDPGQVVPRLVEILAGAGEAAARDSAAHALVLIGDAAVGAVSDLLDRDDPGVRKIALDVLGRVGAARVVQRVAARLEDPDPNVRAAAAEALGGMPGDVAGEALRRALHGDERLVRAHALEALERLGGEAPLAAMLAAYRDPLLRRRALPLLARRDEMEALEAVVGAVGDVARSVRLAALAAIADIFHRAGSARQSRLRALLRELRAPQVGDALAGTDPSAGRGALLVLGIREEKASAAAVARAADVPELRAAAEEVLRGFGPDVAGALRETLPSLESGGRAAVIRVLEQCDDPADHALLRASAAAGEPEPVRLAAIRALSRVPGAAPWLLPLVDDPGDAVAGAAADALVRLASREADAVRAALRAAPSTPGQLRVLGRVGDAGDRRSLLAATAAPDPMLRAAALEGLSRLADPRAEGALVAALDDPDPHPRVAAARGLGALPAEGGGGIVAALVRALRDPVVHVAAAAAEALGDRHAAPTALRAVLAEALPRGGLYSVLAIACVRGLGACRDDEGILPAFDSLDPEVVKAAAAAAGPGCGDALAGALSHPGWDVRRAAAAGLRRNRVRSARAAVGAAIQRERDPVVLAALRSAQAELEGGG